MATALPTPNDDTRLSAENVLRREARSYPTLTGLPRELEADAAYRMRVVALLYAFVFFMVGPVTAILSAKEREVFLGSPLGWAPPTLSILTALVVALSTLSTRMPLKTMLRAGLLFEVAGSYGIAAAQYLNTARYEINAPWAGLSWVAVWMLSFTIMIPSPPRQALAAAMGSGS
jgi:hypothetical protein